MISNSFVTKKESYRRSEKSLRATASFLVSFNCSF